MVTNWCGYLTTSYEIFADSQNIIARDKKNS